MFQPRHVDPSHGIFPVRTSNGLSGFVADCHRRALCLSAATIACLLLFNGAAAGEEKIPEQQGPPVLSPTPRLREAPDRPAEDWVAVMNRNINLDGFTFERGLQYPVEGIDAAGRNAIVQANERRYLIRTGYLALFPIGEAGVSIGRAEYGLPGEIPQNVVRVLDAFFEGNPDLEIVVSDALLDPRRSGGGQRRAVTETVTSERSPGRFVSREVTIYPPGVRVLEVTYGYRGKNYRRLVAEGEVLRLP